MQRVDFQVRGSDTRTSGHGLLDRGRLTASFVVALIALSWLVLPRPAWAAAVPTNTSPPTISGTAQAGKTLTEEHGSWTNQPTSYTYRWARCNSGGTGCAAIAGATAKTYTLTSTDVGYAIEVREIARNAAGPSTAAHSAPTAVVTPAPPPPTPSPPPPTPAPPPSTPTTTSTWLSASPAASVVNRAVTLVAAVTSSDKATAPSGTVSFLNGGRAISGCAGEPVSPTGQSVLVTCQTWFAASTAQLTAQFLPSAGATMLGSVSPTVPLIVAADATSTSLDVPKTAGVSAGTTYTATVSPSPGGLGILQPTGSVQFLDGGQPIGSCSARPLTNAGATCTVTYNAPGSHSISARYGGDANFSGSSAPGQSVAVVKPPPRVLGLLGATMQWTFDSTLTYTKVLALVVNGASGATVTTSCRHRGCPFAKRTTAASASVRCGQSSTRACSSRGTINLAPGFRNRRLSVGAQVTVAITRAGWVGRYYQFTVRARRPPRIHISCLAPGATRPGRGC